VDKELLGEHVADTETHQKLQSNRLSVDEISETHTDCMSVRTLLTTVKVQHKIHTHSLAHTTSV